MSDRERPTGKESGTLGRWAVFEGWAKDMARQLELEVQRHTSVETTNIRSAITARRLRDACSLMAIEFESWTKVPTTSQDRTEALARWDDLAKRCKAFLPPKR